MFTAKRWIPIVIAGILIRCSQRSGEYLLLLLEFLLLGVHSEAVNTYCYCWNSYYSYYYSDRFHGSTLSHGSKVFKFGTHLSRLWSRHSLKYDLDWPNGGAIGTFLIHELWRGIFRALYDLQIWNSAHMCLYSQGTDLPQKPLPSAILFFRNFELSVKHSNNMSSKNHWPIVLKLGRHNLGADPQQFIRAD